MRAETGLHLWGEHYDRELSDIFTIQDDLTRHVVAAIEPEILMGESRRALTKPTTNLDAYDCHMRGLWHHNQQGRDEDFLQAIHFQRRAIDLDPTFARAYMLLARSISVRCIFGYSDDIARDGAEVTRLGPAGVGLSATIDQLDTRHARIADLLQGLMDLSANAKAGINAYIRQVRG